MLNENFFLIKFRITGHLNRELKLNYANQSEIRNNWAEETGYEVSPDLSVFVCVWFCFLFSC